MVALEQLIEYKKAYYAGSPLISDEQYDSLEEVFRQNNPGVEIPVDAGHQDRDVFKEPYVSLRKLDTQSVVNWLSGRKGLIVPKIDGVSMEFRLFKDGFQAITRGGKDRTQAVKRALHPLYLQELREAIAKYPGEQLVFRAECYLPATLRTKAENAGFANLRNLCAGLINSDAGNEFDGHLRYKAWNWLGSPLLSHQDSQNTLAKLGVDALINDVFDGEKLQSLLNFSEDIEASERDRKMRENIDEFEVDGYVIFLDDRRQWDYYRQGASTKSYYDYAVAWKYPSRTAESKIVGVEWSTGDAGWITPVVKIEPVDIGGITVKSINVFNYRNLTELNVKIGSIVKVRRANDVIPHINEPCIDTEYSTPIKLPETCPTCFGMVESVGPRLRCIEVGCASKFSGVMMAWVGAHDMKHFKLEALNFLEPFFADSQVHPIVRLYDLRESDVHACFKTLGKSKRFWEGFEQAKMITDQVKILQSLKINNVGKKYSEQMIEEAGTFKNLKDSLTQKHSLSRLKVAEYNVLHWIEQNSTHYEELCSLIERLEIPAPTQVSALKETRGTVVVTGSIPGLSRKEAQKAIEDLGWKFGSGISKDTNYLISEEVSGSSKFKKAAELNVPVVTWAAFLKVNETPQLTLVQ